jgi:ADP-heptose:LPS heptosyltransferase/tetratricopeptide (TPR) repeat protein
MNLGRFRRFLSPTSAASHKIARGIIRRADAARDERRYVEASTLYREAIALSPHRSGLYVQCAHMLKECGNLRDAEEHYTIAAKLAPRDADLALQLGHFYKSAGRIQLAVEAYQRALAIKPGWTIARQELARLTKAGWLAAADPAVENEALIDPAFQPRTAPPLDTSHLVAELAPKPFVDTLVEHVEGITLHRLGRREQGHWGVMPTLRGVEAIRGFCISAKPILVIELLLNGQLIYRGGAERGHRLARERYNQLLRKYPFNIWIDLSGFVQGRYQLEARAIDLDHGASTLGASIAIAPPMAVSPLPDSDGLMPALDPLDTRSLEDQIAAMPSMVRAGRRRMLSQPKTVLIQRADQLGDLVVSIPAIRRLREILPEARLIGLVSPANHGLATVTPGLFDEMVTIDFPDSAQERRRVMTLVDQETLRERLSSYKFDMAIDLSENESSRPLLLLSGAPVLLGFRSGKVPSLTIEIEGNTHDRWDGHEIVPHTNKLLGLVEWFGAMLRSEPNIVRRADLPDDGLKNFNLAADARFAVLHDGARLQFSRWPYYSQLAEMLLDRTDLHVVMLTDDPGGAARLPEHLTQSARFQIIDRRLPFDEFDSLISFCTIFVGNDSGPKHLAALRGANVVSIHMARNNWNEWGQESGGLVVSRKAPCAGCLIWHEPEDCAKDYVCIRHIKTEEVFGAIKQLIG